MHLSPSCQSRAANYRAPLPLSPTSYPIPYHTWCPPTTDPSSCPRLSNHLARCRRHGLAGLDPTWQRIASPPFLSSLCSSMRCGDSGEPAACRLSPITHTSTRTKHGIHKPRWLVCAPAVTGRRGSVAYSCACLLILVPLPRAAAQLTSSPNLLRDARRASVE